MMNSRRFFKRKIECKSSIVVYQLDKEEQPNFRIGLSVSKKIGNAVVRNRIKRMIRQSITELKDEIDSGKDFVIIARKPCAEMTYEELKKKLNSCL